MPRQRHSLLLTAMPLVLLACESERDPRTPTEVTPELSARAAAAGFLTPTTERTSQEPVAPSAPALRTPRLTVPG